MHCRSNLPTLLIQDQRVYEALRRRLRPAIGALQAGAAALHQAPPSTAEDAGDMDEERADQDEGRPGSALDSDAMDGLSSAVTDQPKSMEKL